VKRRAPLWLAIPLLLLLACPGCQQPAKNTAPAEVPAASAEQAPERAFNPDEVSFIGWTRAFYARPAPEQVAEMIRRASTSGFLERRRLSLSTKAFFAGLFQRYPEHLAEWNTVIGTLEALALVGARLAALPEGREKQLLATETSGTPLDFLKLQPSQTAVEIWWSFFSATGNEEYLKLIADLVYLAKDQQDLNRAVIGSVARWSLLDRATDEEAVFQFLKKHAAAKTGESATALAELIKEVEAKRAAKQAAPAQ
jgi:hypothetical protein